MNHYCVSEELGVHIAPLSLLPWNVVSDWHLSDRRNWLSHKGKWSMSLRWNWIHFMQLSNFSDILKELSMHKQSVTGSPLPMHKNLGMRLQASSATLEWSTERWLLPSCMKDNQVYATCPGKAKTVQYSCTQAGIGPYHVVEWTLPCSEPYHSLTIMSDRCRSTSSFPVISWAWMFSWYSSSPSSSNHWHTSPVSHSDTSDGRVEEKTWWSALLA